jgi:hypothetical protein
MKVGTLTKLNKTKTKFLTVTTIGIAMLTVQTKLPCGVCFMYDTSDAIRQSSANVASVEESPFYMLQT